MEWQERETAGEVVGWLKERGIPTIALETVAGCVSLYDYTFPLPFVGVYKGGEGEGGEEGKGKEKEEKEGEGEGKMEEENGLSLPFWLNSENNNNTDNDNVRALAILLGNERHGISEELVSQCHNVVRIPCIGQKNSLNVGVAYSVCAFEVLRQWGMADGE